MANLYLIESWARWPVAGGVIEDFPDQNGGWRGPASSSSLRISTTLQRNGGACAYQDSASTSRRCSKALPSLLNSCVYGAAVNNIDQSGASASRFPAGISLAHGANFLRAGMNWSDGRINVYNNNTIIAQTPGTYALNTYNYIELAYDVVTDNWSLWVNALQGDPPILTGNLVTASQISAAWAGCWTTNAGGRGTFDDMYVADVQLGDSVAETRFPSANGPIQQWTPSSGNAFERIDNAPIVAGENIAASLTGDFSNFIMPGATPVTYAVHGVLVEARAVRTGAAVEEIRLSLSDGTNTIQGASTIVPQTTPDFVSYLPATAPDGTPWAPSKIVGLIAGVEKTL